MDLATPDDDYRNDSIFETQRVKYNQIIKSFFPKTKTPLIVANIGGFSMDKNIPREDLDSYYDRFKDNCKNRF